MEEVWKYIDGYDKKYMISSFGRIISKQRINDVLLKFDIIKRDHTSYHRITLSNNGTIKRYQVHRLVALHFIKNSENKDQVNHIDNDGTNNKINNLEWCTASENMSHSYNQGRLDFILKKATQRASKVNSVRNKIRLNMIVGQSFGDYLLLGVMDISKHTKAKCLCRRCGETKFTQISHLTSGKSKRCRSCALKKRHRLKKKENK